jgi:hypothetical protein
MQTGLLVDSGGGWQQKDLSLCQEKTDEGHEEEGVRRNPLQHKKDTKKRQKT